MHVTGVQMIMFASRFFNSLSLQNLTQINNKENNNFTKLTLERASFGVKKKKREWKLRKYETLVKPIIDRKWTDYMTYENS